MAVNTQAIKINKEKLLAYLPLALQATIILVFLILVLSPQIKKIGMLSREIKEKGNSITILERGSKDMSKMKQSLAVLEAKAAELEQKLPLLAETSMLIDSLKAITEESKIKFSSIEPMPSIKFELSKTGDVYYELPIKINLITGFFETKDFINNIESNKRPMKISALAIRTNPADTWRHNVEIVISTFARDSKKDNKK
ncbi:MAG: type 4a pilus biogenesis protein PilO [Candidatus Omnitrophota bacterium]|nr:type 4a pilus biogenesis protein PilO [Candidatus Omnitrophota bacterium]